MRAWFITNFCDLYDSNTMKHQCHLYWQEDLELKDKPLVLVFFAPSRLCVSLFWIAQRREDAKMNYLEKGKYGRTAS